MPKRERKNRGWLKIGELSKKSGVPVSTIRYYTDLGLLQIVAETEGGYRLYEESVALPRLLQIRQINAARPSLKETMELLDTPKVDDVKPA